MLLNVLGILAVFTERCKESFIQNNASYLENLSGKYLSFKLLELSLSDTTFLRYNQLLIHKTNSLSLFPPLSNDCYETPYFSKIVTNLETSIFVTASLVIAEIISYSSGVNLSFSVRGYLTGSSP